MGSTSGYCDFFGILIFGASKFLGGTFGENQFLIFESSSSSCGGGVGGFVACPFLFMFQVCFPHETPNRPGRVAHDFLEGLTRIC